MRWARRKWHNIRQVSLSELFAKPVVPSRYVIERDDGMRWAGPYRFQGASFTNVPHYIYYFANAQSAHAAIVGCELDKSGHITSKGLVKVVKVQ